MMIQFLTRSLLAAALLGGALPAVAAQGAVSTPAPEPHHARQQAAARLVLLGTAGGRTSYRGHEAGGISSAIAVNGDVYVVDFGRGWLDAFYQAGLGAPDGGFGGLQSLRAGFITHLHADHIVDYPRLLLFGASDGLTRRKTPVEIFGPGRRGALPRANDGITGRRIVNPDNPTPGTVDMMNGLLAAFATDLNDNILDSGMPEPDRYIRVHDIALPAGVPASPDNMSPPMEPFPIYQDENVRVSAILVSHPEVYPSFAFRFDTAQGSVVFSGDTSRNDNLIRLARGADILVHEVMDLDWAQQQYREPLTPAQRAKLDHWKKSHTMIDEVGSVAKEAGVKMLLLSHLGPPTTGEESWLGRIRDFSGCTVVGKRLMEIRLPDVSGCGTKPPSPARSGL